MHTFRTTFTGLALAGLTLTGLTAAPAAHAQTTVYSNIDDASSENSAYPFSVSGTGPTNIIADDITPITGFAGDQVTSFTFSAYSFNDTDVTATPTAYFYKTDGAGGNPGTLLAAVPLAPVTIASNDVEFFTETSPTGYFALPAGTFWAGISYSGADADSLSNLTQLFYDPPTIGSSNDGAFQSNGPADNSSNPAGTTFTAGGEVTNFGWAFGVTPPAAVPEASTTVSFGLLLMLGLGGMAVAARKKQNAAS